MSALEFVYANSERLEHIGTSFSNASKNADHAMFAIWQHDTAVHSHTAGILNMHETVATANLLSMGVWGSLYYPVGFIRKGATQAAEAYFSSIVSSTDWVAAAFKRDYVSSTRRIATGRCVEQYATTVKDISNDDTDSFNFDNPMTDSFIGYADGGAFNGYFDGAIFQIGYCDYLPDTNKLNGLAIRTDPLMLLNPANIKFYQEWYRGMSSARKLKDLFWGATWTEINTVSIGSRSVPIPSRGAVFNV